MPTRYWKPTVPSEWWWTRCRFTPLTVAKVSSQTPHWKSLMLLCTILTCVFRLFLLQKVRSQRSHLSRPFSSSPSRRSSLVSRSDTVSLRSSSAEWWNCWTCRCNAFEELKSSWHMSQEQRPALWEKWCSQRFVVIRIRYRTRNKNKMVPYSRNWELWFGTVNLSTTNRPVQQKI